MPILDAALAFALTMLVVATAVSQILNASRKFSSYRGDQMRGMIKQYFTEDVQPIVDREVKRLSNRLDATGRQALAKLPEGQQVAAKIFPESEDLIHVSTQELVEKLKRSDFGSELLTHLQADADRVFDELGKRWEHVGARFTEEYRAHSRRWTLIVAGVLALSVNIDSVFILESYLTHRNLSESVNAQLTEFADIADSTMTLVRSDPGTVDVDSLQVALGRTEAEIGRLTEAGFPIGFNYFPYACFREATKGNADCRQRSNEWGWISWVAGVLLTAMLAGLGAPFWYDAVTGIAKVARTQPRRAR